jgi:hypothetical protein
VAAGDRGLLVSDLWRATVLRRGGEKGRLPPERPFGVRFEERPLRRIDTECLAGRSVLDEGEAVDEAAFKALVLQAAALNSAKAKRPKGGKS